MRFNRNGLLSEKSKILASVLIALGIIVAIYAFALNSQTGAVYYSGVSPNSYSNVDAKGELCIVKINRDGSETVWGCTHNLVTNDGRGLAANNTFGLTGTQQSVNVIALGTDGTAVTNADNRMCNGTNASGNAEQSTNGLARAVADAGPSPYTGPGQAANVFNVSINKTFTYTGSTLVQIARICLLNSTAASPYTGSVLYAAAVINTSVAGTFNVQTNGDTFKVVWFQGFT